MAGLTGIRPQSCVQYREWTSLTGIRPNLLSSTGSENVSHVSGHSVVSSKRRGHVSQVSGHSLHSVQSGSDMSHRYPSIV